MFPVEAAVRNGSQIHYLPVLQVNGYHAEKILNIPISICLHFKTENTDAAYLDLSSGIGNRF